MRKCANKRSRITDIGSATGPIRRSAHRPRGEGSNVPRFPGPLRIVSNGGSSKLHAHLALFTRLKRENADLRRNVVDLALQIQEIRTRG
jgi:hypothetical protein